MEASGTLGSLQRGSGIFGLHHGLLAKMAQRGHVYLWGFTPPGQEQLSAASRGTAKLAWPGPSSRAACHHGCCPGCLPRAMPRFPYVSMGVMAVYGETLHF